MVLKYLKQHWYRYSVMLPLFVGLTLIISACSPADLLGSFLGGGPNVGINGQIGAENTQAGVVVEAPSVEVKKGGTATIDQSSTTEVDPLLVALLIIGWLAPSPGEIGRRISKLWRRKDA